MPRNLVIFFSPLNPQHSKDLIELKDHLICWIVYAHVNLCQINERLIDKLFRIFLSKNGKTSSNFHTKFPIVQQRNHKMQLIYFERQTSLKCAHMNGEQWAKRHGYDRTVLSNNRRLFERPVHTVICMRSHIHTKGQLLFLGANRILNIQRIY